MKQLPIPGFPGYEITDDGRVWSVPRRDNRKNQIKGKWRRLTRTPDGYMNIVLYVDTHAITRQVHRLVLETFVGPCPVGMEACHENGNPADNRIENLRWDTRSANRKDAIRHGTWSFLFPHAYACGEKSGRAKLTELLVNQILRECQIGDEPRQKIADRYSVSLHTVSRIANKQTWRHIFEEVR